MALAKKCDRCGKLHEHYSTFNSCMIIVADKYGQVGNTIIADKYWQAGNTSRRYDLCPDCMQALTDFMEAPQRATDNSKEHLTPELVTGIIGQFLDECTLNECALDTHAVNLLEELYKTALADVK